MTIESQIKKRVLEIGKHCRTSIEERIELGRIILSLQQLHDNRNSIGNVEYDTAIKKVLSWLKTEEISARVLEQCHYIAARINSAQVAVMVDKGASFSTIYENARRLGNDPAKLCRFVGHVKEGSASVNKYMKQRYIFQHESLIKRASRLTPQANGAEEYICRIAIKGDEDEDTCQSQLECLLSAIRRIGYPISNMATKAVERVAKL